MVKIVGKKTNVTNLRRVEVEAAVFFWQKKTCVFWLANNTVFLSKRTVMFSFCQKILETRLFFTNKKRNRFVLVFFLEK